MSLSKPLLGAMNCTVCLEPPRKVPVPHCPNGHHVCSDCHAKIQACPVCRDPSMNSRSLMADAMIESLPLPCRFKGHGCLSTDMPMMERDLHEKTCKFREVECPHSICRVRVSLPSLVDHLKRHFNPNVILPIGEKWRLHVPGGLLGMRYWDSDFYCVDKDDFVHKWFNKYGECHWWVYFLGTREEAKKFKVQLDFKNYYGETASFMLSPISIDVPKDDVIRRHLDLVLTRKFVKKFVVGNELFYKTNIQQSVTVSGSGLPMSASVQAGLTEDISDQALDPTDQDQNPPGLSEEITDQALDPPGLIEEISGQALDPQGQGQNPPGLIEEISGQALDPRSSDQNQE